MLEKVKNWKTTLLGILTALVPVMVATGVISVEQGEAITSSLATGLEALAIAVPTLASIWLIFKSKDKE